MTDNYTSPYGFGPVTDAVIDAVADRHDMTSQEMADALDDLPEDTRAFFDSWTGEEWWRDEMGPAIDRLEERLSTLIELKETDE